MKVTKQETLYHKDHGATLKHKCGKRIVALPLLSFSLIFYFYLGLLFFYGLFFLFFIFRPESHPDLWGNHSLHHPFLTWDNALIMMIITLVFTYNSRITTRYLEQNMTLCECLPGCAMMHEWQVWKNYEWCLCHKYDVNYMIMQAIWQWWSMS